MAQASVVVVRRRPSVKRVFSETGKQINFFIFVNMGPYGSENFKTLLLLQIAAKRFETCPEFSSQWSS